MAIDINNVDHIVDEIKKYEMMKKELEEIINSNKECIKIIMKEEGVDEIKTNKYIVRNTEVVSNRFNTDKFKREHKDLYESYLYSSVSRRFSIN